MHNLKIRSRNTPNFFIKRRKEMDVSNKDNKYYMISDNKYKNYLSRV